MKHGTKKQLSINEIPYRDALGLPEKYVPSVIEEQYHTLYLAQAFFQNRQLLSIIESTKHLLPERYMAGTILALRGDPRIDVLNPAMIFVPSTDIHIGLEIERVDRVVQKYKKYGLQKNWILKECPAYKTHLKAFKIAKYLVTNYEYVIFLKEYHYSHLPQGWIFGFYPPQIANHPVYGISLLDAQEYCKWISRATSRYFRLPSEEEWEYVAKSNKEWEFPWGERYKPDCANTLEEKIYHTTPVGIFPKGRSHFGILDMAGNVEELTSTLYHAYPRGKIITDDLFEIDKQYPITRGGCYTRYQDLARTRRRHGWHPHRLYAVGFRLVEEV